MSPPPEADQNPPDAADQSPSPEPQAAKPAGFLRRLGATGWLAAALALSLVANGICLVCCCVPWSAASEKPSPEVALGVFEFVGDGSAASPIGGAEFSLHVTLLDEVGQSARKQLAGRRFRVQQDVEQLLRQAHGADFEDPGLAELKRQLQEQINASLGVRAVADVIITELELRPSDRAPAQPVGATAETPPWVDRPAG